VDAYVILALFVIRKGGEVQHKTIRSNLLTLI